MDIIGTKNMKKNALFALFVLLGVSAIAQTVTNAPPSTPGSGSASAFLNQLTLLIPVIVPMVIALLKTEIPKLPSWTLPILAPILGAISDYLMQKVGIQGHGPIVGALMGSAGVGLRELKDQIQQKVSGVDPTAPPKT